MKSGKWPIYIRQGRAISLLFILLLSVAAGFAEDSIVYQGSERRDPMIPLVGPGGVQMPEGGSVLDVEGIIYDPPANSMILINGDFYKEGDEVNDLKIITIFKDRVLIKREDEEDTLWMHEEILNPEKITHDAKRSTKSSPAKRSNVSKKN